MTTSRIIVILVVLLGAVILIYSMSTGFVDKGYNEQILKERMEKDEFMKNDKGSPFADSAGTFTSLKYFAPDPAYRIVADLEPVEEKKVVVLPTNDNKQQTYVEYARASFRLNNTDCELLILEVMESGPFRGTLFLAFADQTSAFETYGAGRYLDVEKVPGANTITLDFNKAYNPYCAYTDSFSCPLPPRENILSVPIRAGEMTYDKADSPN
jgi:uncharacterized protein (DUF1684 family)